ncbi:MAG: glycosyltransferase family 4 protein [PVC group bacterium]|nr:glycosyltransferase family 4 protein [PVC group bacterium]
MKILMFHPHDVFSKQEPWTVRIKNLGIEFKKKGHEVKIVYFPLDYKGHERNFYRDGMEFIPLSRRVGIKAYINNIRVILTMCKWADIVHFQKCFYQAALPALIGAFLSRKPVHYDWDDWEIKIFHHSARQPWLAGLFLSYIESSLPVLCDSVSVASRRLYEECIRCGVAQEQIVMAPVGADLDLFHPEVSGVRIREKFNIKGPLVIYLGQLHGGQYVEQFIRAAKIVLNQVRPVNFMIVGGGYLLNELKDLTKTLELTENVVFTGAVSHKETPLYLAAADIAVACFEDNDITRCKSPLKIAEYMASGKPIVASNVGEVKCMLGGVGVVTTPGDPQSLAEGVMKLLNDEPLCKRLSQKARKRAEEIYNWRNTAENLLNVYGNSGLKRRVT